MKFDQMACEKVYLDSIKSINQKELMTVMYCDANFNSFNFVRAYYTVMGESMSAFLSIFFIVVVFYFITMYILIYRIVAPSFLIVKSRLRVTSIFMAGIIYPLMYNFLLFQDTFEAVQLNYRFHNISLGILLGGFFSLVTLFFPLISQFGPENFKIPKYPVYISFAFLAIAIIIITICGIMKQIHIVVIPIMLFLFCGYIFSILWAEKKEIEEIEKGKRASEALENFQKMMGSEFETREAEKTRKIEMAKQRRVEMRKEKTTLSTGQKVMNFVFNPETHWFINTVWAPFLLLAICITPFKANPLLKTPLKYMIYVLAIMVFIYFGFRQFFEWYINLIIGATAVMVFFLVRNIAELKKPIKVFLELLGIGLISLLTSYIQNYVDDGVFFIGFYFSMDIMVIYVLLVSFKIQIFDTLNNVNLMILGEKEALLNCYTSPIFGFYLAWPYYIFRGALVDNKFFNLFSISNDFFIDTWSITEASVNYTKTLIGFFMVVMTVKMIYYIVSDFKINSYLRRTLYSIYLLFFVISTFYATSGKTLEFD